MFGRKSEGKKAAELEADAKVKRIELERKVDEAWELFQHDWSVGDEFEDWKKFAELWLDDDEIKTKWEGTESKVWKYSDGRY